MSKYSSFNFMECVECKQVVFGDILTRFVRAPGVTGLASWPISTILLLSRNAPVSSVSYNEQFLQRPHIRVSA